MTALERVTEALEQHGSRKYGKSSWNCPGPLHSNGDRNPSLIVGEDKASGRTLLHCFTGCEFKDIMSALGLEPADAFDEAREVARYPYYTADGSSRFEKVRLEGKIFTMRPALNGAGAQLYRLPEVKAAIARGETTLLVNGEKAADRLWEIDVPATCSFAGEGNWKPEYGDYLKGASVIMVADRDATGIKHAMDVQEDLRDKVASLRIVQSRTMGEHDDIVDHLNAGYAIDQLVPLRPENEISRRYRRVNWFEAFARQGSEVDWLIPPMIEAGTVNALFGKPGAGKSLIAAEWAVTLVKEGKNVLIIDDENREADTVDRLKGFGCHPSELDRLIMYNFAGLPPLDTEEGGRHLTALAEVNEASLVILDTTTRLICGEENTASTWLQLYRCSLVPLKGRGITVLRIDHPGKDDTKGQRGSSAKSGDVDSIYRLVHESGDLVTLICEKSRSGHHEQAITYRRHQEKNETTGKVIPGTLWHEMVALGDLDILPKVKAVSRWFDQHDVPRSTGRPRLRDVLNNTQGAPTCDTTILALVAKYRRGLDSTEIAA